MGRDWLGVRNLIYQTWNQSKTPGEVGAGSPLQVTCQRGMQRKTQAKAGSEPLSHPWLQGGQREV